MTQCHVLYDFTPHALERDFWGSKRALYEAFFGAFHDFIAQKDPDVLARHGVTEKKAFLSFCQDWTAEGKDSLYAMGFAFHPYFLMPTESLALEAQDEEHFIGWCWRHDRFRSFITFLVNYFAYWRNDEGCTRFAPYNHADRFFASSWAALVDTGKLFYFTSDTVYVWHSFRIKYILDHIPGVATSPLVLPETVDAGTLPPDPAIAGYLFQGWFASPDDKNALTGVTHDMTLYPRFLFHDRYDYWEREEPTLTKVLEEPYKKCDPA